MVDFPGADFGKVGSEDVSRPFVAKHHGVLGRSLMLVHGFGEFFAHGLLGPPNAGNLQGLAEFLHHFLAAIVRDNDNLNASLAAIFYPFGQGVSRFFFGMKP